MPTPINDSSIEIKTILDPAPVDNSIKHVAWDAYHAVKNPDDFKKTFDSINLPNKVKHDLWSAKFTPNKYQEDLKAESKRQDTYGSISAEKKPANFGELLASNVHQFGQDIRYGTGVTKAGQLFKAMTGGGHGIYAGVRPEVAEFVASMPLGILTALEGYVNVAYGHPWEGSKQIVKGTTQALEMLSMILAPEGTVEGGEAGVELAGGAIKGVKQILNPKSAILPERTALREIKIGKLIQDIISDNVSSAGKHLQDAQEEVKRVKDLITLTNLSGTGASKASEMKLLYKTYGEAVENFEKAREFEDKVSKFGAKLASHKSPEQLITRTIKQGKEMQSEVRSVLEHLEEHPRAIKYYQDTTMRGIIEKYSRKSFAMGNKVDWLKVQNDLYQKGDMAKDLLGSRYYPILQEVNKMAKQQIIGKAAVLTTSTLAVLGLPVAWYLRSAMRSVLVLPY
jgi:hypothetical protein